jgi:predicted dehydrogenase
MRWRNSCATTVSARGTIYESIGELARNCDVLAFFGPNFTRVPALEEAAKAVAAGAKLKGLIIEKPLARNLAEADRVMQLSKQIGAPTAYFENQIFMKSVQGALRQLKGVIGSMGPLALARAAEEHAGPHNAWFWDPTPAGWRGVVRYGLPFDRAVVVRVDAARKVADVSRSAIGHCAGCAAEVGCAALSRRVAREARRGLHENAGGGFRDRCGHLPEPGDESTRAGQFTVSWMYDKQGLRLLLDGLGPGYALEANSLRSPLEIFIGDAAAAGVADAELALEKSTASQGLLAVQPNEPDLYGYVDENLDAVQAFTNKRPALLDWAYGREIVRLTMAAYLSAEEGRTIDLTDPATEKRLATYVPAIQQGRGGAQLLGAASVDRGRSSAVRHAVHRARVTPLQNRSHSGRRAVPAARRGDPRAVGTERTGLALRDRPRCGREGTDAEVVANAVATL